MKTFRPVLFPALFLLLALPITAEIRSMPALEGPPASSIEGTITSVSIPFVGGGPIVTLLDGLVSFDATGATVRFSNGTAGTTADFEVGQRLVAFVETTPAMPQARSIVILAQRTDVTFMGKVDAIDRAARTLTVLGSTATVTDRTAFGGPRDGAGHGGLENLQAGDLVLLSATADARTLVATRVVKLAPSQVPASRLHGIVGAIGTDSWTIVLRDGTRTDVKIDAETKIVGAPKVGDDVEILVRQLPDGSVLALLIAGFVPPSTVPTERYQGVVRAIETTSWTIGPKAGEGPDRHFAVSDKTRILGEPKVGDEVGVLAERQEDGFYLALVIAKAVPSSSVPTAVAFEGVLNRISAEGSMGTWRWLVGDTSVMVSRLTIVLGDPKIGDRVRVEGLQIRDGSVMAARIAKL